MEKGEPTNEGPIKIKPIKYEGIRVLAEALDKIPTEEGKYTYLRRIILGIKSEMTLYRDLDMPYMKIVVTSSTDPKHEIDTLIEKIKERMRGKIATSPAERALLECNNTLQEIRDIIPYIINQGIQKPKNKIISKIFRTSRQIETIDENQELIDVIDKKEKIKKTLDLVIKSVLKCPDSDIAFDIRRMTDDTPEEQVKGLIKVIGDRLDNAPALPNTTLTLSVCLYRLKSLLPINLRLVDTTNKLDPTQGSAEVLEKRPKMSKKNEELKILVADIITEISHCPDNDIPVDDDINIIEWPKLQAFLLVRRIDERLSKKPILDITKETLQNARRRLLEISNQRI